MKIAAAYIRVSTDDQTELSPDSQIKQVREYASAHDYIVPDEYIYRDDGISGRTARKRPAFNEMIGTAKLKPKPFDAILVWKFSRFARNREDSIVYKSMLRKLGIEVISISEPMGDDKMSVLIEAMIEAMDEYYSINLAEEVKRGMLEKLSRGKCVNSAPIGYTFKDGELVIDEEKAFIVRRIYQEYADGKTMLQIARDLNNDGIKTLHGNNFENRTVEYILRNPLYAGKLRYTQGGGGSRSHYHSDKDTMIVDGSHAPVIEPKVWDDIQSKINATKLKYKKYERDTPVKHNTMLRGLIKCSSCGSTLCINSTGHYQCNAYAHGKCNVSHSIKEEKINEAVINALEELDINGEITLSVRRPQIQDDKYEQCSKLLKREYTKLERVKEAYQNGIDTLEEYKRNKAKIMADIDKIQSLAKKYETSKSSEKSKKTELKSKYEHFIDLVNDPETPPDKLNSALKGFVEKIVFDRVKSSISIFYYC